MAKTSRLLRSKHHLRASSAKLLTYLHQGQAGAKNAQPSESQRARPKPPTSKQLPAPSSKTKGKKRAMVGDSSDKENEGEGEGEGEGGEGAAIKKVRRTQAQVPLKARKENGTTPIGLNLKKKPASAPDPHALLQFAANVERPENFDEEDEIREFSPCDRAGQKTTRPPLSTGNSVRQQSRDFDLEDIEEFEEDEEGRDHIIPRKRPADEAAYGGGDNNNLLQLFQTEGSVEAGTLSEALNDSTDAGRNDEGSANEVRGTQGPKPKRRRTAKESTAKTKEEAKLSYYNGNPAIKMLLRDVQLSLKALIVFDYAFPETSRFETIMKEEFNEHAEVYVETGMLETHPELTAGMQALVSARKLNPGQLTDVKRSARIIAKTDFELTDDAVSEAQKERVEALIGTPAHRLATYLCGGTLENPKGPFQHKAVKKLLLKSVFEGSTKSKSLAYHLNTRQLRHLFDPLPAPALALMGAALLCAIEELKTGKLEPITFNEPTYSPVYRFLLKYLTTIAENENEESKKLEKTSMDILDYCLLKGDVMSDQKEVVMTFPC